MTVRIAARSYDAVDTIQTGIGTFNERYWERILSADSANVDVVFEHLVQRLDTLVVRCPSAFSSSAIACSNLSAAYSSDICRTKNTVSVSTTYFFVALFTSCPNSLYVLYSACSTVVVHAPPDVLQHLPVVVLRQCVYQALNEHALGTTRRDALRSRCISRLSFRMIFLAIVNTYLSWPRLSAFHMMTL